MEKVYLLLRKNQQTGPYTYEELLQQQLASTDLIWVEGKSTTWLSPTELTTFRATHTMTKKVSPDAAVSVSKSAAPPQTSVTIPWYQQRRSPEAELEERALAIRKRAEAATDHPHLPAPATHRHYRKHIVYQEEESPVLVEIHTLHKKNVSLPQLIAAGVITALIATGWYNRSILKIVRSHPTEISQAAAPVTFQVTLPPTPKPAPATVIDTIRVQPQVDILPKSIAAPSLAVQQIKLVPKEARVTEIQRPKSTPALVQSTAVEKKQEVPVNEAVTTVKVEKKETVDTTVDQAENNATAVQETQRKKKGLGQTIKNIFKKKKKDNETEDAEKTSVD